jgi:hypothetical protein
MICISASSVPSFAGSTPQSLLEPFGGRLRYAIRDNHQRSRFEIGGGKRIYQHLSEDSLAYLQRNGSDILTPAWIDLAEYK